METECEKKVDRLQLLSFPQQCITDTIKTKRCMKHAATQRCMWACRATPTRPRLQSWQSRGATPPSKIRWHWNVASRSLVQPAHWLYDHIISPTTRVNRLNVDKNNLETIVINSSYKEKHVSKRTSAVKNVFDAKWYKAMTETNI